MHTKNPHISFITLAILFLLVIILSAWVYTFMNQNKIQEPVLTEEEIKAEMVSGIRSAPEMTDEEKQSMIKGIKSY